MPMEKKHLLQPNCICRIISLGENPDVIGRLSQMGILPGTEVTVVRVGPLGDPLELAIGSGQNIALRKEEFESLEWQVVALPLSAVRPGPSNYRVRELRGGLGFQHKMMERGLVLGAQLRVEEGYPYRVYLFSEGFSATVGRGEGLKLILEPVSELGKQSSN